jgi:hypothetical protein
VNYPKTPPSVEVSAERQLGLTEGINLAYNDLPGPRQATIKLGRVVDAFVVASNEFLFAQS